MPEGHTIHRVARDHRRRFLHESLDVSSPQGRFAAEAAKLNGDQLEQIEAYGKHLVYHWSSGRLLHIHLGLYGKFRLQKLPLPEPVGAVRLRILGSSHGFDLRGPNCCELLTPDALERLLARLGPDPLRSDAEPDLAWRRILRSRAAIGSLLLDQSVIAGIGNVYRAEALFQLRIHPDRPGRDLTRGEFDLLWELMVEWLKLGVRYNRIITADARDAGKTPGRLTRGERLMIYKKSACPACDRPVSHWDCGNRTIYACRRCQQ
jgi:endonuclease-8